jgi:hypothetical protein
LQGECHDKSFLLHAPPCARDRRGRSASTDADSERGRSSREVAGVEIPRSAVTVKAATYARASYPDFLFNHCMRTFLFGALMMKKWRSL